MGDFAPATATAAAVAARGEGDQLDDDAPLFATDDFRMYCMKILPCAKRFVHDWVTCPFSHPGEKAKRRDPRYMVYTGIACPSMKKAGACPRAEKCPYAHNVFEYWLHPTRYRTQLCNDGMECRRRVCFFAHSLSELRVPAAKPFVPPEVLSAIEHGPPATSEAAAATTEALRRISASWSAGGYRADQPPATSNGPADPEARASEAAQIEARVLDFLYGNAGAEPVVEQLRSLSNDELATDAHLQARMAGALESLQRSRSADDGQDALIDMLQGMLSQALAQRNSFDSQAQRSSMDNQRISFDSQAPRSSMDSQGRGGSGANSIRLNSGSSVRLDSGSTTRLDSGGSSQHYANGMAHVNSGGSNGLYPDDVAGQQQHLRQLAAAQQQLQASQQQFQHAHARQQGQGVQHYRQLAASAAADNSSTGWLNAYEQPDSHRNPRPHWQGSHGLPQLRENQPLQAGELQSRNSLDSTYDQGKLLAPSAAEAYTHWVSSHGYDPQRRSLQEDSRPAPAHGHYPRRRSLQVEDWRMRANPFARTSATVGTEGNMRPVPLQALSAAHAPNAYSKLFEGVAGGELSHDNMPPSYQQLMAAVDGGPSEMMGFPSRWPLQHEVPRKSLDSGHPGAPGGGNPLTMRQSIDMLRPSADAYSQRLSLDAGGSRQGLNISAASWNQNAGTRTTSWQPTATSAAPTSMYHYAGDSGSGERNSGTSSRNSTGPSNSDPMSARHNSFTSNSLKNAFGAEQPGGGLMAPRRSPSLQQAVNGSGSPAVAAATSQAGEQLAQQLGYLQLQRG